ncbi:MAG: serine/threonine protein kinase, partial [Planctomycetes bacterium]|nr:serine/threonine protein kinase [Planctomycetota bacterium]
MTESERFERAMKLFQRACNLPAPERSGFLAEACGADVDLRREVESLLEHDAQENETLLQAEGGGVAQALVSAATGTADAFAGYEVIRELSHGGQGVVYQAIEKATKRKVAIKVLLEGPYASASARRRFEREIELVASLKHPNIVAIYYSGLTHDGRQFCVMDYIRGVSLTRYVREQKLPLEAALKLFATVCEAVQYAHNKGVIHRDLKPANIVVDADGNPKVLDFGLAKQIGGPEQT